MASESAALHGCLCGNWTDADVCEGCGRVRTESGYRAAPRADNLTPEQIARLRGTDDS